MSDEMENETTDTGMRLVYAGAFDFKSANRVPARCHIRVWRARGRLPVVIATELPDNPGMSITNAAERVAAQVWERLLPDAVEGFVWIERYPVGQRAARGGFPAGDPRDGEMLDQVEFRIAGGRKLEMDEADRPWRRISRANVERMVGQPLPMAPDEV